MKLVFYSGGDTNENASLDQALLRLARKRSPKMTIIPADTIYGDESYQEAVDYYSEIGIKDFLLFPVDQIVSPSMILEAFQSDMIYLSGGNTYYFLYHLRKKGLLPTLRSYVKAGGILVGESAGSILMTPNIGTASVPHFDGDANFLNVKNISGLNLVGFEFVPHYENKKKYDDELEKYSKKLNRMLVACPDGSGIVVNGKNFQYHGDVYGFLNGKKYVLSERG